MRYHVQFHAEHQVIKVEKISEETYRIYAHDIKKPIDKSKSELEKILGDEFDDFIENPQNYSVVRDSHNKRIRIKEYRHPYF